MQKGAQTMSITESQNLSIHQLCEAIDLLDTCMDDYLYVYDFENDFYYISSHAQDRFSLPSCSFHDVALTHSQFVYPPDFPKLKDELALLSKGGRTSHSMQYRWTGHDGQPIWIDCRGTIISEGDKPLYLFGCINEIGAVQKADNVSGLLGESTLKSYIQQFLPKLPNGFLLRIGLDDFKKINEKLGTDYGDRILKQTADDISSCILPGQKIYRVQSDEFIVLDFAGGTEAIAIDLYKRIRSFISKFVADNHYEAVFTISAGLLTSENIIQHTYSDIVKYSDFSLNEAKRQGKNLCYIFQQADYDKFCRRQELTKILRQSINEGFNGFEAYFQPLFASRTNTLYGAESLMRFRSESGNMISPGEFIPILEETGLIIPVGQWMLHTVLKRAKEIIGICPDFHISINVSYIQVMKSDIINEIIRAVSDYQIPPSNVIVELTESGLLVSNLQLAKTWSKLNEQGIQLALDDFGTGYSNFHYLHTLRPNIIKIDRSFTLNALENEYEYNLLALISGMVHDLNLTVCIEGIETNEERLKMLNVSPDYYQGFFFGKPCPYEEFVKNFIA